MPRLSAGPGDGACGTAVGDPEPLFSVLTPLADVTALAAGGVGVASLSLGSSISGWYIQPVESGASRSVYVGGNVSPSSTVAAKATLCRITTAREFSDRGTILFRGAFPNVQSGLFVTWGDDGHTLTLACEQACSFTQADTLSVTIPCTWVL